MPVVLMLVIFVCCRKITNKFGIQDLSLPPMPWLNETSDQCQGGAWCGNGFHEDGMRSARAACEAIGLDMAKWPAKRRPLGSMSLAAQKFWKWVSWHISFKMG